MISSDVVKQDNFFNFMDTDACIFVKPKNPKVEKIQIYYHRHLKHFLAFTLTADECIGEGGQTFKDMAAWVMDQVDSTGSDENIYLRYPSTWKEKRKKKLLDMLKKPWEDSRGLNTMLLMLI